MSSNVFRRLQALFQDPPLLIGIVSAIADGTATITLAAGGVIQARGVATTGAQVFVRNGLIEGVAPSLTAITIDV